LAELDRLPTRSSTVNNQQHLDVDNAKAKNRYVYEADLRRELFGELNDNGNWIHFLDVN
jgi:hypothetical protein